MDDVKLFHRFFQSFAGSEPWFLRSRNAYLFSGLGVDPHPGFAVNHFEYPETGDVHLFALSQQTGYLFGEGVEEIAALLFGDSELFAQSLSQLIFLYRHFD